MHRITIYACDFCQAVRTDYNAMFVHEAAHYGLTTHEYKTWLSLQKDAEAAGRKVGLCKNPDTDAAFDKACEDLTRFETEHQVEFGRAKYKNAP